ncbi:MAG: lysophospholipid acyltransferase family protein [Oscillospiraceae bacterium]|jgi:1-acyl-sn-glycerol-3-phosphate acyltransferase
MIRTLGWVIWLFGYLVSRMPAYWRARSLEKKGRTAEKDALVARQCAQWTKKLLHHIKIELDVRGRENLPAAGDAVVYAANHQSFIDIPVLLNVIYPPQPLLARSEIAKVPMLAGWMRLIGCLFVPRGDARASVATLREGEELLKSGKSLIIFPEGTRSKSSEMGTFMAGAVRIAWKAGVPIVPVAIEGTYKGLEGNDYRVLKKPVTVRVAFLPPVDTQDMDKPTQRALPAQLQETIKQAKDRVE